jgi:hypothetical protein
MATLVNAHFYNRNEVRSYPVDDGASALSDAGVRLPPDLICDLNLRWPQTLGRHAFLSAVTSTVSLVTVTVQAAATAETADDLIPLAVVSVRKPVEIGRVYPLVARAAGVAGWIVFGSGVDGTPYAGRFSTPGQSRLTPRTARAYRPLPLTGLGVENADQLLSGVVTLAALAPLQIVKEERVIDGATRDCVVVRLVDDDGTSEFPLPEEASQISGFKPQSLFQQFAGPCAGRPESRTCGCPAPIEFINAVTPDCAGRITVRFDGFVELAQIELFCGAAITSTVSLTDACLPPQIPSSDGLLPSEYEPTNVPVPDDPVVPPQPPPGSESFVPVVSPPNLACFRPPESDLGVAEGLWQFADDRSPTTACPADEERFPVSLSLSLSVSESVSSSYSYEPSSSYEAATASGRNVAVFAGDGVAVYRRVITETKLLDGPTGAKRNAQLILNYRPHETLPGRYVYYAAEIDYDTQQFKLVRFNGSTFQTAAPVSVPGIALGQWYRITAEILPGATTSTTSIAITLESVADASIDVSLSISVSNYRPSNGLFGVGTNRALSRFSYLSIDEVT